jgi:hypothetical protein
LWNLWYPINNFSKPFLYEVINRRNQSVFTSFLGNLVVEPPAQTAMEICDGRHQLAGTRARKGSLARYAGFLPKAAKQKVRAKKVSGQPTPLPHPPQGASQVVR